MSEVRGTERFASRFSENQRTPGTSSNGANVASGTLRRALCVLPGAPAPAMPTRSAAPASSAIRARASRKSSGSVRR